MNTTKRQEAKMWEDGLRTDPNKKSYEWWYFDASFDDGSTFVVTYFTKQPQNVNSKFSPQIQIVYTSPNGEKHKFLKAYDASSFYASVEKCDVKMGPHSVSGDLKEYILHIELPELSADLTFLRVAPSYSTTEKRETKTAYFGWFPAIPYGTVKGTITFGGKSKTVKGTGYHDHNWGIINMKDVCDYWYWGRGSAGEYHIIYSVMYLPKILGGKHASIFYLAKHDKLIVGESDHLELTKTDISPARPSAIRLPKQLTFTFQENEDTVTIRVSNPVLIESADPYESESFLRKTLSHLFSSPRYVRYNSDLELAVQRGKTSDIKKGKSLYEIMILR